MVSTAAAGCGMPKVPSIAAMAVSHDFLNKMPTSGRLLFLTDTLAGARQSTRQCDEKQRDVHDGEHHRLSGDPFLGSTRSQEICDGRHHGECDQECKIQE